MTARELGAGGPGYCFFEVRCATTGSRTYHSGWYLNWRAFRPPLGMRLIADYRSFRTPDSSVQTGPTRAGGTPPAAAS